MVPRSEPRAEWCECAMVQKDLAEQSKDLILSHFFLILRIPLRQLHIFFRFQLLPKLERYFRYDMLMPLWLIFLVIN